MTVSGSNEIAFLKAVLKDGSAAAKKSSMELMAWNRGSEYFREVLPYTSSEDEIVKSAAYKALSSLAGPGDQPDLIKYYLLLKTGILLKMSRLLLHQLPEK